MFYLLLLTFKSFYLILVAAKHKETKQYYTLYNTLEDTKTYMKKELSLLNSICDSYPEWVFLR